MKPNPIVEKLKQINVEQIDSNQETELLKKEIKLNPNDDQAYVAIGQFYQDQDKFSLAAEFFKKAVELNPRNDSAYAALGSCYLRKGELSQAIELFRKAIGLNAKNHWGLIGLGSSCQWLEEFSEAIESFNKAIALNPKDVWGYIRLGTCYLKQKKYFQAEKVFKKAIDACPGESKPYRCLSILYNEIGRHEAAEEYFTKANTMRLEYYELMTVNNYRKIKTILDKRCIRLVCVEYPMHSIEPLKKIFEGQEGVIFVDNENIFKNAINKDSYNDYFTDMFAGDFGHCTNKGNRLLADNIANAVLKELFGTK